MNKHQVMLQYLYRKLVFTIQKAIIFIVALKFTYFKYYFKQFIFYIYRKYFHAKIKVIRSQ